MGFSRRSVEALAARGVTEEIQKLLADNFDFYAMTPKKQGIEHDFLAGDFKRALGKVYKPFGKSGDGREYYSLALEKSDKDKMNPNAEVKAWLEQAFHVVPCELGTNPEQALAGKAVQTGGAFGMVSVIQFVVADKGSIDDAITASPKGYCPCPAGKCDNPELIRIIVLPHAKSADMFTVKPGTTYEKIPSDKIAGFLGPAYANIGLPKDNEYYVWQVERVSA